MNKQLEELVRASSDVVDLGCGDGAFTGQIASLGPKVYAIDREPHTYFPGRVAHPNITYEQRDIQDWLVDDRKRFDGAVIRLVLHFTHPSNVGMLFHQLPAHLNDRGWVLAEFWTAWPSNDHPLKGTSYPRTVIETLALLSPKSWEVVYVNHHSCDSRSPRTGRIHTFHSASVIVRRR